MYHHKDLLFSKALATKRKYVNTSGQTSAFLLQVESDDKLSWVSPEILGPVLRAQDKLKQQLGPFFLHLVSGAAMQQLKKDSHNNNNNQNHNHVNSMNNNNRNTINHNKINLIIMIMILTTLVFIRTTLRATLRVTSERSPQGSSPW